VQLLSSSHAARASHGAVAFGAGGASRVRSSYTPPTPLAAAQAAPLPVRLQAHRCDWRVDAAATRGESMDNVRRERHEGLLHVDIVARRGLKEFQSILARQLLALLCANRRKLARSHLLPMRILLTVCGALPSMLRTQLRTLLHDFWLVMS
jgi:hypothetical protein